MTGHAIICGGSIAGLFAASVLRRVGWSVSVYERAPEELSGRGAGIVTHPQWLRPAAIVLWISLIVPAVHTQSTLLRDTQAVQRNSLRFVHRHYPLNQISRGAAEAAACANDQGRFWEFHRGLFASGAKYDAEGLQQQASDLELDLEAFQACVDERRFQAAVEADLAAGREAGVTGTPAFFVNGIHLQGARPLDEFVSVIEKELGRSGS